MRVDIIIHENGTQSGSSNKNFTTKISYVNQEATNQQLSGLAEALNDLTENSYLYTEKQTTEEL